MGNGGLAITKAGNHLLSIQLLPKRTGMRELLPPAAVGSQNWSPGRRVVAGTPGQPLLHTWWAQGAPSGCLWPWWRASSGEELVQEMGKSLCHPQQPLHGCPLLSCALSTCLLNWSYTFTRWEVGWARAGCSWGVRDHQSVGKKNLSWALWWAEPQGEVICPK